MQLQDLGRLGTIIDQFADFIEKPENTWGTPESANAGCTRWERRYGQGISYTLERITPDNRLFFRLWPEYLPHEPYMAVNCHLYEDGTVQKMTIAVVIRSNRLSATPLVHYLDVDYDTMEVRQFTEQVDGEPFIWVDFRSRGSVIEVNLEETREQLASEIANRTPVWMLEEPSAAVA